MKKTISLIVVFAIIMMFFLTGSAFAATLDTLSVDVDKTTIRPGQEVKLTINFGTNLGAYTFDVSYDNKIFDYVSVDGGTANNTTDKVKVTFYDTIKGRENMSIVFKAKDDITTSNPTELTVTGEGLANTDATITYDDITTPIVKNITVEPEYQDYVINLEHTGDIIANEEKDMVLSYSSSMGRYYEHARLIAQATTPEGANVKLTGIDADTQTEQDIIQSGWGDPQGYKIGGKDVSQVLNLKALFTHVGDYTITLKLIDRDNSDSVIAQKEISFKAIEKQDEVVVPPSEDGEEQQPEQPEEKPTTPDNNGQTTDNQEKPTTLPKTGNNIYVPMVILMFGLAGITFYYNKKNIK